MTKQKFFNRNARVKWGNFGTYIIRLELRKGPRKENPIYYVSKEKGEKIDIIELYENLINNGIEVAYFIELGRKSFGEVLREAVEIVKLIYRGYFKAVKKYRQNFNHDKR